MIKIIYYDVFRYGAIPLIMLVIIIISAILVITFSYQTRLLTVQKDLIINEKDTLDTEWRSLVLEETELGCYSRIERLSIDKLQMIHVDPMQEHIVIAK